MMNPWKSPPPQYRHVNTYIRAIFYYWLGKWRVFCSLSIHERNWRRFIPPLQIPFKKTPTSFHCVCFSLILEVVRSTSKILPGGLILLKSDTIWVARGRKYLLKYQPLEKDTFYCTPCDAWKHSHVFWDECLSIASIYALNCHSTGKTEETWGTKYLK